MAAPVVITGAGGSGKSFLAELLAARLGWKIVNVGDLLKAMLTGAGLEVANRRAIGPAFLDVFGVEAYLDLAPSLVGQNALIDGVRSMRLLARMRCLEPTMTHVHRLGPAGSVVDDEVVALFRDEAVAMERSADIVIPYFRSEGEVEKAVGWVLERLAP